MQVHVIHNRVQMGPYTEDEVHDLVAQGVLSPGDLAWSAAVKAWIPVSDLIAFQLTGCPPPPPHPQVSGPYGRGLLLPAGVSLADPWTRLGAVLLDRMVEFLAASPGLLIIAVRPNQSIADLGPTGMILAAGAVLVLTIFNWVMMAKHGETVGKRLMGIRVVRLSDLSPPGYFFGVFVRVFVTCVIYTLLHEWSVVVDARFAFRDDLKTVRDFMIYPLLHGWPVVVDALFVFRDDRRTVHDFMAGTIVVRK